MTGRVKDKVALVIGAGSVGAGWGNGKAAAVLYAREGAKVLAVDRSAPAAAATSDAIREEGGIAEPFTGDMTREEDVAAAAARAITLWGRIDILHFNIGINRKGGVTATTVDDWDHVFNINLRSAYLCAKAVLPGMVARKCGALVFISTLASVKSGPYSYVSYEASKAGLNRLSQSIASEHAADGVRSNVILPGMIATPHADEFVAGGKNLEAFARARAEAVPMKRQGTGWDIANAAIFLASDEAGFITGVELRVDGGAGI
ncbi:MAG: SDR family oxidoreductase [Paracoccaceae bacterium]